MNSGISLLRITATIMVVIIHVAALVLNNSIRDEYTWIVANLLDSLSSPAVPLFLMISGSLTLDPLKYKTIKTFYSKRGTRLLPGILFWTFIYAIISNIVFYGKNGFIDWSNFYYKLYIGEVFYHLWYIYMFIGLILVTPFLHFLIRKLGKKIFYVTIFFSLISLALCFYRYDYHQSFFIFRSIPYISFYLLGYCLKDFHLRRKYISVIILAVAIFITFIGKYITRSGYCYMYEYLSLNVFVASVSYFLLIKDIVIHNKNLIISASNICIGVYYIHPILIKIIEYSCLNYLLTNSFYFLSCLLIIISSSFITVLYLSKLKYINKIIQ